MRSPSIGATDALGHDVIEALRGTDGGDSLAVAVETDLRDRRRNVLAALRSEGGTHEKAAALDPSAVAGHTPEYKTTPPATPTAGRWLVTDARPLATPTVGGTPWSLVLQNVAGGLPVPAERLMPRGETVAVETFMVGDVREGRFFPTGGDA